jgi:RHS repeat-associated protein
VIGLRRNTQYIYSATQNNGRITQRKNWLSGEVVTYTYDSLQRLTQATATGPSPWSESYTFDGFGNLTGKAGSNWVVNASTNRINGLSYDANGNQANGASSAYDIDNRLLTWDGTEQYRYDPSNKRTFRRWTNGIGQLQETYSMYGVNGKVTAELAAVYDPAAGVQPGMVLTPTATYQYVGIRKVGWNEPVEDRLGTKPAGSGRPYGENVSQYATHQKDATGLHYADQRYYASSWGRFLTPDPYKASAGAREPGSWNRYAYVQGDPVNYLDPDGLVIQPATYDFIKCAFRPLSAFEDYDFFLQRCAPYSLDLLLSQTKLHYQQQGRDGGGRDRPARECDTSNPTNARVINFIRANQAAAETLARETGLGADFLLAWADYESGWGLGSAAAQNNNYFGLTTPRWPGATQCSDGSFAGFACFAVPEGQNRSLLASGRAALSSANGRYLNPALEAQRRGGSVADIGNAIANAGFNSEYAQGVYGDNIQGTHDSVQRRIHCLNEQ